VAAIVALDGSRTKKLSQRATEFFNRIGRFSPYNVRYRGAAKTPVLIG
jgi:hypothetical protein